MAGRGLPGEAVQFRHHQGVTFADGREGLDGKVRRMLQLDGWTPDMSLAEQAGYFILRRPLM
ncbi:MAG TPA: hypothetical protein VMV92_26545 [Streptosporangiaceae bacterium]|nr:hypothetical protein [Streptosporangiaceae bacterium]